MKEVYRKAGRTVRFEHGQIVTVAEAGEAIDERGVFSARPVPRPQSGWQDEAGVVQAVQDVRDAVPHPLYIERLVVTEGTADHEAGDVRWEEASRRVHLSIVYARHRALIDLGDFDFSGLSRIADAMRRIGAERPAPARLTLAPAVAAALVPQLIGVAPPNVILAQSGGGRDGKGLPIEETALRSPPWPNWYRPSYRVPPQRAPLNVRATCTVTAIDPGLPEAIALLAPVDGLRMRVLCVDGPSVYPASIHIDRIDAIAAHAKWYPYAAGSFGSLMTVV